MKILVLFATLLLAACGVEKREGSNVNKSNLTILASATWCQEDLNRSGVIETIRFYSDGRAASGKWDGTKQSFEGGFNLFTWKISGETLTLSADNQVPRDKLYRIEFVTVKNQTAVRLLEQNKATPFLLEQCSLANDPR